MQKKLSRLVWIAALLAVMIALVLPTAAETGPTVTVQPDVASLGESGGTVTYTVTLVGPVSGVESIGFTMTVPEGLTYASASFDEDVEALEKSFTSSSGQFLVLGFNATGNVPGTLDVTGSQVIGKVAFKATSAIVSTKATLDDTIGNSYYMNGDTMVPITLEALDAPVAEKKVSIGGTVELSGDGKLEAGKVGLFPADTADADIPAAMQVEANIKYLSKFGTFEFTDIPAGRYKLAVYCDGYVLHIETIDASENVTGKTIKLLQTQNPPAKPEMGSRTASSITLSNVAVNAKYAISTTAGVTDIAALTWQDGFTGEFIGLTQHTAYYIYAYYPETETHVASALVCSDVMWTKRVPEITLSGVTEFTYDGQAHSPAVSVTNTDGTYSETRAYQKWNGNELGAMIEQAPTDVGKYRLIYTVDSNDNQVFAAAGFDFTITPATVSEIVVTLDGELEAPVTGEQFPTFPENAASVGVSILDSGYSNSIGSFGGTTNGVKGETVYYALFHLKLDKTNCNFNEILTLKVGNETATWVNSGTGEKGKWSWKWVSDSASDKNKIYLYYKFPVTAPATATGITLTPASLDETVQLSLNTDWRTALAAAGVTATVTFNDGTTKNLDWTDTNLRVKEGDWKKGATSLTIYYGETDEISATLTFPAVKGKTITAEIFNFTAPNWAYNGVNWYYKLPDIYQFPDGLIGELTVHEYKVTDEGEEFIDDCSIVDAGTYRIYLLNAKNWEGSIYEDYTSSEKLLIGEFTVAKGENKFSIEAKYGEEPQIKGLCDCSLTVTYCRTKNGEYKPWSEMGTPVVFTELYAKITWDECANVKGGTTAETGNKRFAIFPKNLTGSTNVEITVAEAVYSGDPLTPAVTVKFGEKELVEGKDFKVTEYINNEDVFYVEAAKTADLVNAPTVTISFIGNYSGSASKEFTIQRFTPKCANVDDPMNWIQTVVYGVGDFVEPILVGPKGEKLTCTLTYTWDVDGIGMNTNTEDGTYDELKAIIASKEPKFFMYADKISWIKVVAYNIRFGDNKNLDYGDSQFKVASIAVNIQKINFTTDNALTIKSTPTYGDDWSDIITINDSLKASLGDDEVSGKFKLVQTGKPDAGENIPYQIVFTSDDGVFKDVPALNGTVKVAKKTLIAADFEYDVGDKSKTYDGTTASSVTVKVSPDALVNASDVVTVTTQTAVYNDKDVAGAKVIIVTPTAVSNANYTVAAGTAVTIPGASITPKPVTVNVAGAIRKYGEPEPTFGGAVNSETPLIAGDDLGLSYSTEATATSDVGMYAINGAWTNGNYKVTFVPGKLMITKAPAPTGDFAHEYKVRYNDTSKYTIEPAHFGLPDEVKGAYIYIKGPATGDTDILRNNTGFFRLIDELTARDVGKSISWEITISSTNHEDITATVKVTLVDKSDAAVTFGDYNFSQTYGNDDFTLTATAANPGEGFGMWSWTSSDDEVLTVDENGKVTIVGAGSATITATYESDTTAGSKTTYFFVVSKKYIYPGDLVVSGDLTKVYDGTTTSNITLKVKDSELVNGDTNVTVNGSAAYNSANVAEANKITFTLSTIENCLSNSNYYLSGDDTTIEFTDGVAITPATLTPEGTAETTAPYGAQISSITLPTLTAKWNGTTVPGAWAWVESGTIAGNAGDTPTLTARFTPENSNHAALDVPTTVTVTKANYTGTTALSMSVWSNKAGEYRYPLDALQSIAGTVGSISVTDPDGVLNGTPSMDGTAVVIKVNAVAAGKSATITIPITGATNYNDFSYTLTVSVSNKTDAGVDITLYPVSRTYGDKPFTPTVKIDNPGENGKLRWESTDPAVLTVDENGKVTVVGVGKAYIKVYYESDTTIGSDTTLEIAVLAKSLTVTAPTITTVKDAEVPDLTQYVPTVEGLINGDTATGFTLAYDGTVDMTTSGEYAITVSGGTIIHADCYTVTYVPGKLSISMTYAVTVTATDGGTASASTAVPVVAGTPITLTAAPADGYTFVRWEAVAPTTLAITGNGFTMPAEAVTVKAVFARTAPTIEVETVKPSGGETEDGEISGVNDTMEYSADGGVTWIAVATGETTIRGLKPGSYLIRYRAIGSAEPSAPIEITLEQKPAPSFSFYPIVFRLYFETNGGKEIAPQLRMLSNRVDFTKITTTREGYIFTGWYADPALTVPLTEIRMRGNRTVYAGWEEIAPVEPEVPETPEVEVPEEPEVETPEVEPIVNPFTDVAEADWFYADVLFAVDNALMTGATETTFAPDATVTRGDFIRMLWLIEGSPKVDLAADLWDVPGDADYREAIEWAVLQGLLSHNEGIINPTATLTRDQMTTIVYRYATAKQIAGEATGTLDAFKDTDKLGDWAKDAMVWATANGILHLRSADLLDPTEPATRAELAAILHGMMTLAGELEA